MQTIGIKQAWALGTYRRFDALKAPAFFPPQPGAIDQPLLCERQTELVRLPTHLPEQWQSLSDYLADRRPPQAWDWPLQLSQLLRNLAAPQTFEPLNAYKIHTPVPSVRCLFPYRLLIALGGREPALYEYHANYHGLEKLTPLADPDALLQGAQFALFGVAKYWKLADKYGEFTPFPVTLELGGMKAQFEHLVRLLGWREMASDLDARGLDALGVLHPLESCAFGVSCTPGDTDPSRWLTQLPVQTQRLACWRARDDLSQRFPQLPALAALFKRPARPSVPASAVAPSAPSLVTSDSDEAGLSLDILQLIRKRNSGNDSFGFAPRSGASSETFLPALVQRFNSLNAKRPAHQCEGSVQVHFVWLDRSSGDIALYDRQLQRQSRTEQQMPIDQVLQAALPNQLLKFNMAAMTLSVLMTVDVSAAEREFEGDTLRRLHLEAGCLAQDLALAATSLGVFARPVRMFHERIIEQGLKLPGQLIYQVLMGFSRRANYKIGML